MKIDFDDKSYIEFKSSKDQKTAIISIVAKDGTNPLRNISNSVEITLEQLKMLYDSVK